MHPVRAVHAALLLAVSLGGCAAHQRDVALGGRSVLRGETVLPCQFLAGLVLLPVRLQGGPRRWFLLDTGSNLSTVTPGLAAELGFPRLKAAALFVGGKPVEPATVLPRLALGELVVEDLFAMVAELPGLSSATGVEVSGLLGAPVFKDVTLIIDYPGRQVTLSAAPLVLQSGDVSLPLVLESLRPEVEVSVGGERVRALVDTGFNGSLQVPGRFISGRSGGDRPELRRAGLTEDRTGRLDVDLELASLRITAPLAERSSRYVIGSQVFGSSTLAIDQPGRRLALRRATSIPAAARPLRSFGFEVERREGAWRVAFVLEKSGASEAGLVRGDQVVSITARGASPPLEGSAPSPDLLDRLASGEGDITVEVLRGKQVVSCRLTPQTLVP